METFIAGVFYLLLIDGVIVTILAWLGGWRHIERFRTFSRYFPITRGWATWYLVLVLWIGFLTFYL